MSSISLVLCRSPGGRWDACVLYSRRVSTGGWREELDKVFRALLHAASVLLDNKVVLWSLGGIGGGFATRAFAMLEKWFSLTRLETRTKESNIYASIWVCQTLVRNESEGPQGLR